MEEKNKILESAEELFDARENIVDLFKEGTFPNKSNLFETKEKKSEEESEEESEKERIQKIIECIENESKVIDSDLFKNYFDFLVPRDLAKKLFETRNEKKNHELLELIKSRQSDLKVKIKEMSEDEKEMEKPDKILKIVEEILEFNKQNQSGKGLKILTSNQMLSRLPISLAQLKTGNNSENLKNEIRQILYSLYRSKNLTKQFYKSLIDTI